MKSRLIFSTTLVVSAIAARTSYTALSSVEQENVQDMLAKWKVLYGPIAEMNGYVPAQTESMAENGHSVDELTRFHNTIQAANEAQRNNPEASFSPFNQFALLTEDEFKEVVLDSFGGYNFTDVESFEVENLDTPASSVDWSTSKCISPVRDQGQCGSCWAFAAVGTAEVAHCIATGELLDLSEQQLVSCNTKYSNGCNGGYPPTSLDFMSTQGICMENAYPYTSGKTQQTGTCETICKKKPLALGKTKQTIGESSLVSVLNLQPTIVVVESGNDIWRNYKSGVVTQCPGAKSDHAVIAIGYGTSTSDYFKIKNSWGSWWGDNGFIYLKRGVGGKGMCNVVEDISYPDITDIPITTPSPTSTDAIPSEQPMPPATSTARPNTTQTPTSIPSSTPVSGSSQQVQLVSQTNIIRAAHGIAPVTWDAEIAGTMQAWADTCPGFDHGGAQGWQNLATNTPCSAPGKPDCATIVGASWLWYNQEETYWNYETNQCNGDWAKCGHFSNMMSPSVTTIACGWSECPNGSYVWCNYHYATDKPVVPRKKMTKEELKMSLTGFTKPSDVPSTKSPIHAPTLGPTELPVDSPTKPPPTKAPTQPPTHAPVTSSTPHTSSIPLTPTPSSSSPATTFSQREQILSQTNTIRAAHYLAPVTWDIVESTKLQAWANTCPGGQYGGPEGWQNLGSYIPCGSPGEYDCSKIVGAAWIWYNEQETYWDYSRNQCNGDWNKCADFSNMMSPGATSIACAWSQCNNGNFIWCNYITATDKPVVPRINLLNKNQLEKKLTAPLTVGPQPTQVPATNTGIPASTTAPTIGAVTKFPIITPVTSQPPISDNNPQRLQLLYQTNKIRAAHNIAPVTWDAALAIKMQVWADSCPGFKHGGPSGWQNLATNTPCGINSKKDCSKIVGASWLWYNKEETYWNYASNKCNGEWSKCGHFSNMMSPSVTSMACGWSDCANGSYVWCNYNSATMNPKVPQLNGVTKAQVQASLTQ